ncbi:hypothetical protein JHJ32_20230 [Parapedobacter sp. ISTM3]|uniref:hypothetical protein n=1 Tax=Parapedobacter sp. ISTM3 TaxID=2800130 RepID=UPI001905F2E4|nr:hypothetical protein [Parapedobacter sp. ISTM3]MBK1442337.1 hypothetical protein [Parapedobacter sp. ISTM3]
MRGQLSVYPDEETDRLIVSLLWCIPQFIAEMKDTSLLRKVYFTMRIHEHHLGYVWYRFQRYFSYRASAASGLPPHDGTPYSKSEYIRVYQQPSQFDLDRASLAGMICAMSEIFASVCTVYHINTRRYHYFGEPHTVSKRLLQVAQDNLPFPGTDAESDAVHEDMDTLFEDWESVLLRPFMVFIFRYLRDEGYNWQYRSDYLAASKRIESGAFGHRSGRSEDDEQEEPDGYELQPVEPEDLAPGADQYKQHGLSDISFESSYIEFVQEDPEPSVSAYIEVYGVEPDGYPPRMDEY